MTLADLKTKNLIKGASFDVIKGVADVAAKENSIKVALDKIDGEVADLALELGPYKDSGASIIRSIEETLQGLEDGLIRTQAMKGH